MGKQKQTTKPKSQKPSYANGSGSSGAKNNNSSNGDDGTEFPPRLLQQGYKNKKYASSSLAIEDIVPNAVFVARHALSSAECQEWIQYSEEGGRWDLVAHPATRYVAHRE